MREISATEAIARYRGPVLLAHGADDVVVPPWPHGPPREGGAGRRLRPADRTPPIRPRSRPSSSRAASTPGCTSSPSTGGRGALPGAALGGPLDPGRGRRRSPPPRRPTASRTVRRSSRPSPTNPGGLRTLAQVARPGATQPIAPRRGDRVDRELDRRRLVTDADRPGLGGHRRPAGHPRLRRSPARARRTWTGSCAPAGDPAAPRTCSAGTFIVCRDRDHLRELAAVGQWAGHLAGAAVAIALVTPDPARRRRAVVHHVRPGPGGPEHDAGRLGARDRQRAGDGVRARPGATAARLSRPTTTASTCCRSAIRRTRPISRARRRPAAAGRSPRWSTRNAGSADRRAPDAGGAGRRPTASGTSARRSRSTRPASRAAPPRTRTAARTPRRRP